MGFVMNDHRPAPRLAEVTAEAGAILVAIWTDGHTDCVNLSGWLETGPPYFHRLRDPVVFARAAVTDHGLTVEWNGDPDLALDTVHLERLAQEQAGTGASQAARARRPDSEAATA